MGLGQDKVSEEEETDGAVERDPGKERNIGFEEEEKREGRPVLKPRDQNWWAGGTECFVGEVDR